MAASGGATGGSRMQALDAAAYRSLVAAMVGIGVTLGILSTP